MEQTYSEAPVSRPQPEEFKLRKLKVSLGNAYVRLAARDRQKVIRAMAEFTFREEEQCYLLGSLGPMTK